MASNSAAGSFTLNLSAPGQVTPTKIVVSAYAKTKNTDLNLYVNGSTSSISTTVRNTSGCEDYIYEVSEELKSLKFSSVGTSKNVLYVKSITVYYESEGEIDPPTDPDPVELSEPVAPIVTPDGGTFYGEVTINLDFAEENQDLAAAEDYVLYCFIQKDIERVYDREYDGPIVLQEGEYTLDAYVYNIQTGAEGPHTLKQFKVLPGYVDELTWTDFYQGDPKSVYAKYTYTSSRTGITYEAQMAPNGYIQLRSTSESGLVIKENPSHYLVQKIELDWNSGTGSTRVVDFYGKNTPYTSPAELYATTGNTGQGTKIGSLKKDETLISAEDDYLYMGLRSNSGALYLDKITVIYTDCPTVARKLEAPGIVIDELARNYHLEYSYSGNDEDNITLYTYIQEGSSAEPKPDMERFAPCTTEDFFDFPNQEGDYTVYAYAASKNLLIFEDSEVSVQTIRINAPRPVEVYAPIISPEGGEFTDEVVVTLAFGNAELIDHHDAYSIIYTTDGSDPMDSPTAQSYNLMDEGPRGIYLGEGNWTVNARVYYFKEYGASDTGWTWSPMSSETFIVTAYHPAELVAPVITPESGTYRVTDYLPVTIALGQGNENLDNEKYTIRYRINSADCEEYCGNAVLLPAGEYTVQAWIYDSIEDLNGPEAEAYFVVKEGLKPVVTNVTFDFTSVEACATYDFPEAPEKSADCWLNDEVFENDGILMSVGAKVGTGVKWWNSNNSFTLRVYKGNSITFSAPGKTIKSADIVFNSASSNCDIDVVYADGKVILSEPSDGKNSFIKSITFEVEGMPEEVAAVDFVEASDVMESLKAAGLAQDDAEGNVVSTIPVVITGKLHVIYVGDGVAHLQDEHGTDIRLEGVPADTDMTAALAIAEIHAYVMENRNTGMNHLVYVSHINHEEASQPVPQEISLANLAADMEADPTSHMHSFVIINLVRYDVDENAIYTHELPETGEEEAPARIVAEDMTKILLRNDLGINLTDNGEPANIMGVLDKEGDSYVLVPTSYQIQTSVKAIYAEGVSVTDGCITAPAGSRIFNLQGMEVSSGALPAGIYLVVTPQGATVKCLVK